MTDSQLLAIALASVPTMITVLIGILINNARLGDLRHYMEARFNQVDQRFAQVDQRFAQVDQRFDQVEQRFKHVDRRFDEMDGRFNRVDGRFEEVKELWRSELHRVEEVFDARLKHLEERT
jgi:predicted nuclease with TOPRIM domain